jgi:hypothetical protein
MSDKRALFEAKINEAGKGPGFERVDHGPNFKPGWKANGNSGGGHTGTTSSPPLASINITDHSCTAHDGKFKKQTKRVETKFEYLLPTFTWPSVRLIHGLIRVVD